MAQRRMTSLEVTDTDAFLDMGQGAQLLYFHLNSRADDDGFVANPKKVLRAIGGNEDDLKLLVLKKFLIAFEDGVCVIKHWRINNFVRKDLYKETKYLDHRQALFIRANGAYTLSDDGSGMKLPPKHYTLEHVDEALTERQLRIGKGRVGKDTLSVADAPHFEEVKESEEEEVSAKKPPKYPNAKQVFALWGKYPKNWERNTTQLIAAENLFEEKGLEEVKNALDWYKDLKDRDFCPAIGSPNELDSKWEKFERFVDKQEV